MFKFIGAVVIVCLVIAGVFWLIDNLGWRHLNDDNNGE